MKSRGGREQGRDETETVVGIKFMYGFATDASPITSNATTSLPALLEGF